ncbi:MAG: DUF3179 domain-containing protein [Acidobacteria bacterium]|nr:DUF3179 domain-containing protein [Acidobacteriota bacterium]
MRMALRLLAPALVLSLFTTAAAAGQGGLQGDEVVQALYDLVHRDPFVQRPAARFLGDRGDPDAVPFMVATIRYDPFRNETLIEVLEKLTGQDFGWRYEPWAEWTVRQGIEPHPVFRQWKADFLARLNPRFGVFLDPERPSTIDYAEIQWGGVAPEGIPSLDDPAVIASTEATYLTGDELVFGVALAPDGAGGSVDRVVARAYPLRILDWHEMTNDTVAGIPVALSYCTLCGSAILFDRRLGDRTFTFATSGLLYRSNKLMFDRQTETLWSNLTGKPVLGSLVDQGLELTLLPVIVTTWADWKRQYPETSVLSLETGHQRDYSIGAAYGEYFASPDLMFPVARRDDRLPDKAWVFGLRVEDAAVAFDLAALQRAGVLNTEVGDQPAVLVVGAGRAVRAYDRRGLEFEGKLGAVRATILAASDGSEWRLSDVGLHRVGGGGFLKRLPGHLAYWFGWCAFFPDTELWTGH